MSTLYGNLCDDYFVNMNLNTEMALPSGRETVLNFFERVQKTYPSMRNFYTRDNGDFILEEDKDQEQHRWISIEPRRICSGCVNPTSAETAMEQHMLVLQLVPYMLSVSPLDCEALDFMIGFDFAYRGNHDEIVSEVFGGGPLCSALKDIPSALPLNFEPSMTIALEESCRRQARLLVETRTSAYQVRRGDFQEEPISIYFTVRQYGSLPPETTYEQILLELQEESDEILRDYVIDRVVRPLAQAIDAR
ncbi:hypothetical protein [uncultured Rubinisphaera sp.]|uniref:hypothetical protein n=1 Tax=uncultured Rubinisphaera sp. TaxID=1678686 RepID=UPI0030D867D7|tara:strand:+ start:2329 stop:3075 length:747 start_codon:yes stop_codon:yes gene_type:complete